MDLVKAEQALTTRDGLNPLLVSRDAACITFYLETGCEPDKRHGAAVRLRNLLADAAARVTAAELDDAALDPVRELAAKPRNWPYQGCAMAVFLSSDIQLACSLPYPCADRVVVDERFYVVPLLPLVADHHVFYMLLLSQQNIRLFRCTRHDQEQVDLGDVPTSLEGDLAYDVFEESIQVHTGGSPTTGGQQRSAVFHGHGAAADKANIKRKLRHLYQHIDTAVCDRIGPEDAPLVLAGLGYAQGLYRELNHCHSLVENGISQNPDDLPLEELRRQAWNRVAPRFGETVSRKLNDYASLAGHDSPRADADLKTILPSALSKRIDTLFITEGAEHWGKIGPDAPSLNMVDPHTPGATELCNLAAVKTVANGGHAYLLPDGDMPADAPLAAIYRY